MPENKQAAPVPRDYDEASFSEMLPFRSKKISLFKSPIFYFVAVTAVFNVLLFGTRVAVMNGGSVDARVASFELLVQVVLFYLLALALLGIHSYAKSDKPITYYLFPTLLVYFFMKSPLWEMVFVPFNTLGGGFQFESQSNAFPVRLWSAFAGPGLREEFVKGIPSLIGAALTVWAGQFSGLPPRIRNLLRIRAPLDGVLMGFAAGCAFLFAETGGQYVHTALNQSLKASHGNLSGAFGDALMLLLPRAMNGWVGHMAWAGILGYAIGLAVIRPKHGWKLVLGGWGVAALLHGLWDSGAPGGALALYVIGGASGLLAIACLVKARQLDASLFGRSTETFGSIVVGAGPRPAAYAPPVYAPPAAAPAPFTPPPATPAAYVPPAYVPPVAAAPGFPPAAPMPPPIPGAAASALMPQGLVLAIDMLRLGLHSGSVLDLAAEPGLAGRAQGLRAEVTQHPTKPDVLGLKNLGATSWYATLRDNTVQPVPPQRSLRLAAGVSIDFGGGVVAQIVAG
jgi:RsiW-degrading membrane proteinase PrsW (M82 family)